MGLLGNIATFGVGYALGAKTGPGRVDQFAGGIARLSGKAKKLMPARISKSDRTIDVREVQQVMTAAPDTVRQTDTLQEAARLMMSSDIGDVIVESKKGRVVGMVTDRDLAIRATAKGLDPTRAAVREVMTAKVTTLAPTDSVQEAIGVMRARNVRRLPVVEDGRAIGIISLGDISVETEPDSVLADISAAPPDR
jgi:CBS domain-containing protein